MPTSWEAFRNPIKATQDYAAAMGQRLALYAHDPIGGMTADFQDIRGRGRINDVVWGAVEDVVAKTPVALAEGYDFVRAHPPKLPDPFHWQDSEHPAPPPRKLAPIVERTMRPLLADAALRPPRTYLEQSTAGTAKVAMLLGEPETAAGEAVSETGAAIESGIDAYHDLREAGEELRAGLEAGKTWDQAYAALPQRAKGVLGTHWFRVGAGDITEAEEAAGWRARPPRKIPTIRGRKPINSRYAGGVHPSGVRFTHQGFPDFEPHAIAKVQLNDLTGGRADRLRSNEVARLIKEPEGYLWHHVEDGKTMLLISERLHKAVPHTGGSAVIRNGGFDR